MSLSSKTHFIVEAEREMSILFSRNSMSDCSISHFIQLHCNTSAGVALSCEVINIYLIVQEIRHTNMQCVHSLPLAQKSVGTRLSALNSLQSSYIFYYETYS